MTNSQHRIAVSRPGRRAGRRRLLLASTALTAALLAPSQGRAGQPAPMTTPQGGTVVGGSATISQAPGTTTITQTSQRAAIDWQSFNLGSKARVTFNQPNAQAIALNRVIANNPSIIAGRIDANGRIVLVNQDGVVFTPGSEVNAESLVVSTSGISPKNFMAGKLIFDQQPKPGARIVNDGRITMKQAGLAAFVAPEVINRGTITAQLGHVVLAGASAFTLNLSGDGLISINVTQAVRQIDLGGRKVTALVTNEGTIIANGGRITLTARAVDGLIQQLLDVGGTLRADSVGRQPGAITIQGVGGDLQVAGQLLARGETPGSSGGTIAVDATGNVSVASTARIDASGPAGGGVVALGTDAARALQGPSDTTAPKAARVAIAQGATISADATRNGNGGRITVLSRDRTTAAGTISAQGAGNGDGGLIEISSDGVISLSGTDTTFAPSGRNGTILLDPQTLIVTSSSGTPSAGTTTTSGTLTVGTDSSTSSYIDASILDSQTGAVELSASSLISIASAISSSSISTLAMNSGGDIRIAAPVTLTAGSIEATANGTIEVSGALGASSISLLDTASSPTNKIDINANIDAPTLSLDASGGTISNAGSGYVTASVLDATASVLTLAGTGSSSLNNAITTLGSINVGSLALDDETALTIAAPFNATVASLAAPDIRINANIDAQTLSLDASGGTISNAGSVSGYVTASTLDATASVLTLAGTGSSSLNNAITTLGSINVGSLALDDETALTIAAPFNATVASLADTGSLDIAGSVSVAATGSLGLSASDIGINANIDAPTLSLDASGGTISNAGSVSGYVTASTLDATASVLTLAGTGSSSLNNAITTLGSINVGSLALDDETALTIAAPFNATVASLAAPDIRINANIDAQTLSLDANAGTISNAGSVSGYVTASTLDATASVLTLAGTGSSSLNNAIDTLGSINVGSLALDDETALTIAGPFNVTVASLTDTSAGGFDITGAVSATGSLSLDANAGTISNSGSGTGYINASSLNIVTASSVILTGSNSITTLEDFVANSITLVDQSALTLAGTVSVATHGQVAFITRGLDDTSGATFLAPDGTIEIAPLGSSTIAGTLDLGGTSAGNVNVSTNFVTLLADSGAALLDLGTANAGPGTLAGGVIFDGNLPSFTPTLMVEASGSIVNDGLLTVGNITVMGSDFSGSGAVTADSLAGSVSGFASLQNGGNSIKVITSLSAGSSIDVADSQPLTIAGALSAGSSINVADSQSLNIAGTLSVASGGNIVLSANGMDLAGGTILANSGAVTLAPLSFDTIALGGTSTTALDLSNQLLNAIGANSLQIGTVQTGLIENDGSISLSIPNILMDAGTININQPFLAQHSSLIVQAGGEFTGNGGITVAALGAAASLVALTGSNSITTLGSISAAGSFTLDDNAPLTIAGPFTATNASITNTGSLDITGSFNATDASLAASDIRINANLDATTLSLDANAGTITNAGSVTGYVTASNLDATASLVALTGSNAITTLGSISAGSFTLDDNAPLTIAGPFNATDASLAASDIRINANLDATILSLDAGSGTIANAGSGYVNATTLDAAASLVALTGSNAITTLGSINVGNFTLDDNAPITIAGPFNATSASFTDTSAGGFDIAGQVSLASLLALSATGGSITSSGTGSISAPTLDATASLVALTGSNSITTLGSINVGSFTLDDNAPLTIAGPFTATNASLTDTSAGGFDIAAQVSLASLLALSATSGSITSSGTGSISAPTLDAAASLVALTGSNSITTLGSINVGTLTLDDEAAALTIAGSFNATSASITNTGSLTIAGSFNATDASLAASDIRINANLDATTLSLDANGGTITNAGSGYVNATTLDAVASLVALTGSNAITTLGNVSAGSFTLDDNAPLTVAGPFTATNASLTDTSAGGFDIAGQVSLASLLALSATSGSITSSGTGSISAPTLDAAASLVALTGSNAVTTLGSINVGTLTLDDEAAALTIAGPFNVTDARLTDTGSLDIASAVSAIGSLGLAASNIGINASLDATILSLDAGSGTIANAGSGYVNATTLDAAASLVALTGSNAITTLGSINVGSFTLDDNAPLTIAGPFTATNASLTDTSAGGFDIAGQVSLASLLALSATGGSITSSGTGSISAPTLDATASLVALTGSNSITTLGSISAGNFTLDDNAPLTIAGPFNATSASLTDTSGGGLDIAGQVSLASLLALSATSGSITSSGTGSISAPTLDAAASLVALTGSNVITTLGSINVGTFTLDDNAPLTIAGSLIAQRAAISAADLTIPGVILVDGALSLATSGTISETGTIDPTLLQIAGARDVLLTGSNTIDALGSVSVPLGNLALVDQVPLTVNGPVYALNISLDSPAIYIPGAINTPGTLGLGYGPISGNGPITAATLTSNSAVIGDVALTGTENVIGTLGGFDAAGHLFALTDATALTVAGPVSAKALTITATGQITLDGADGGSFSIGGQFLPTYVYNGLSPRNGIDSVLQVIANGAPANGIVQTGQFNIDTGSLQGQPNTLFMLLPDGADAKFNDLNARSTDLAISLINGYAQGTLYLHYLLVAGGLNGQTAFVGQIAGLAGSAAAHNGKVVPVPGSSYRFNSCIIGSVSCTVLPVAIVPERNPLDDFDISPRRRRKLDANVRLPGVAAKDY